MSVFVWVPLPLVRFRVSSLRPSNLALFWSSSQTAAREKKKKGGCRIFRSLSGLVGELFRFFFSGGGDKQIRKPNESLSRFFSRRGLKGIRKTFSFFFARIHLRGTPEKTKIAWPERRHPKTNHNVRNPL